ncbi:MAG TPA: trypsin-like peptidase domain-containing protein [Anaerovoracaceae bacterium]|nr:trypsin-like peptidase domain-containing protein [Anaerovoracaceae bacterium]
MDNWDNNYYHYDGNNYTPVDNSGGEGQAPQPEPSAPNTGFVMVSPEGAEKAPSRSPSYVTKKTFVIVLIICMVVTAALTAGGFALVNYINTGSPSAKTVSATNYTLAKATGSELSIQEIIAMNENSVVEIRTESVVNDSWMQQYVTEGAGSGVIVQDNGYIITNNHVIDGASKITVTLKDGTEYSASLVATDSQTDIAVIKIKATGLDPVTYGDSSDLSVGDLAVAIGNPLGELGGTATCGIISSLDRELTIDGRTMNLLQTDASINPGNSGGGLFNQHGQLIGIVAAKSSGSDVEGLGFAIPINKAAEIASDLIENGKVSDRASIGIEIADLTSAQNAMQYGYKMTGIYIRKVNSSNARDGGLKVGDLIYYVEDTQIDSYATLTAEVQKHKVGDTIEITVVRENKTIKCDVKLVEAE